MTFNKFVYTILKMIICVSTGASNPDGISVLADGCVFYHYLRTRWRLFRGV